MGAILAQLQHNPRDLARWQQARRHLLSGEGGLALPIYRELVGRYPAAAELWFELGNAAAGALDFSLAHQAYTRSMELAPGNAPLHVSIGQQYQGLRRLDEARACYERAVCVDPESVDARISLAVWFEKERRFEEAWENVERCLARYPRDDQARYFRAFLLHRQGRNLEAETSLRDLIRDDPGYPYVKYASRHLLGVVLDQLGQYAEAMRWLCESKALVRQLTDIGLLEREYDRAAARRSELARRVAPDMIRRWREEPPLSTASWQLAFLGGHPRSGTTLLEQILDAHPAVRAFDEPEAFDREIARQVLPAHIASSEAIRKLDGLAAPTRANLRQRYTLSLLREGEVPLTTRVLLDKNPSPTASLPLWLRVWPELKVIVALRDPRDVVISCFFLNLMLNGINANYLSLERTVKHYEDLMGIWLRMRETSGFQWVESRYEDVVSNLEGEGRRVTEFLGLTWHGDQAHYYETARRKWLVAPTYHDVTQPVYRRAVGRWERYAEALEPFLPRLAPFCAAFGYRSP